MTKDEAVNFLRRLVGESDSAAGGYISFGDKEVIDALIWNVRQAVMLEREACAQIAESDAQAYGEENPQSAAAADEVARQIRNRP